MLKLKKARAIREVFYPEWLANTMVVKKKKGRWRACVDFTDLNKSCPKDPFPMPRIDQLVDATVGHPWMSFLDAFRRYYQIPLALDDHEKIVFVTPTGNYHDKVMPYGLKNTKSTYQKIMTRMFKPQLGKSIEVYIDDMVMKIKVVSKHVGDLANIFEILRRHKLRLNASKCSFGVGSGKFLGYMVTHHGIEINPNQIKAINNLQPPRPPIMSRPEVDEVLFAYIAVASHAASLVLIRVDNGVQRPIYYVSKLLHEAEVRYLPLKKVILAVVHAITPSLLPSSHNCSFNPSSASINTLER